MPALSLQEICRKACMKNVHSFTDVGDLEYHQISDILSYVKSPEQLHQIEELSPQIKGLDAELWQKFIVKEIPNWELKNYAPKNPLKWYKVYKRYKREQAEEIKRDEEVLRETMMGIKKARDSNLSKVVDLGSLPKLPRDPRMVLNNGGVPISRSGLKKEPSNLMSFASGSKTKMKDGKSVLVRARREAKEIAQMGRLSRPTHQLSIGRVAKAPAAMVKEYRTANKPVTRILSRRFTAKIPGTEKSTIEDRENRLRALTSNAKSNGKPPNYVDSDDESENDEIFDKSPQNSIRKPGQLRTLSTTKAASSKRPSDVISELITKRALPPRPTTTKSYKGSANLKPSITTAPNMQKLQREDARTIKSESVCKPIPLTPTSTFLHARPPKTDISKKRKIIDVFNRGATKRSKPL
ncbi:hypothetical protein GcM3_029015 [Golovinomyces cichoracearum]|uniref:Uncharacterized protein n=1 Tax=Golovinomyces cichoracearum TaxID=62708 RepID=A0A420J5B8_9PEZI|nr:hypothetical protein GcM3_029015 [Golovinomyces cichoracearum]